MSLFLDCEFCSIDLYVYPYVYTILSSLLKFCNKFCNCVSLLTLFLLFKTVLVILDFKKFVNFWKKKKAILEFLLLLFSHSVMSDSLQPHGLQHAKLPCPSLFPRVGSNSCPLSQWCHPTFSSSVVPFSSCPQSFLASISVFQWVSSSHQVVKVLEL